VGDIYRINSQNGQAGEGKQNAEAGLGDWWLDFCEMRRQTIIMELRHIDRVLIEGGRLRRETLPTRVK